MRAARPNSVGSASLLELRAYIGSLYLPAFAATLVQSLVLSVLPLYLKSTLGADAATVGAVVGIQGIGSPLSALPAGLLADRLGTRFCMLIGAGVVIQIGTGAGFVAALAAAKAFELRGRLR